MVVAARENARGLCLEAHDLALSKLAAFREKDRDFVRTLLVERMVRSAVLLERLDTLPVDAEIAAIIAGWLRRLADELSDRPPR